MPSSHTSCMDRMREIREQRNLTQEQLAALMHANQGYVSKLELGVANPTLDMIRTVAAALNVEPYELFSLSDLKARALLALGSMEEGNAQAAIVVLESMAGKKAPE
jgi:transcriptional regulator with XRE-family HTH domain